MKVSQSKIRKVSSVIVAISFLIIWPFLFILGAILEGSVSGTTVVGLLLVLPFSPVLVLFCINDFYSFIIDEKGVTRKLPGKNSKKLRGGEVFIPWDEVKEIGVGERQSGWFFQFLMYFSKINPERIYFRERHVPNRNREIFFVVYKKGLLEEVLKYVPEEKIKDVNRIKECSNPYQWQPYSESEQKRQRNSIWDN